MTLTDAGLLATLEQTIVSHQLLLPRSRVVLAVSGGPDSVAMLHALVGLRSRWDLALHIVHVDHQLRPESSSDAAFVQELGARWRLPVTIVRRDVRAACAREGWSLEDGARRIRYDCLLEAARCQRASRIATAHTADDQAETVLLRLIRGTGLTGLAGIPIRRPLEELLVVRPLLETWRQDVLAHLRQHHESYRQDATNHDLRRLRNRVRHELLPLIERSYNPHIKAALTQLAEQSACDSAFLEESASRQWSRVTTPRVGARPLRRHTRSTPIGSSRDCDGAQPPRVAFSISAFLRQPKALQRQLVRLAISRVRGSRPIRFEFRHWTEIERLFTHRPTGTLLNLPGGMEWRRDRQHVLCDAPAVPAQPHEPLSGASGHADLGKARWSPPGTRPHAGAEGLDESPDPLVTPVEKSKGRASDRPLDSLRGPANTPT